jgi:hypothetical protein
MASGKTDNLMTAILAHGRDPSTGEYLTAAQRKALFKKSQISGSKVFGGGAGGGVRGGGGRGTAIAGGALALRQSPGEITNTEISQKLDRILFLIKKDADTEKKYREALLEKQQRAKEKMLRGSAERGLEGANKEKEKKVDKAKSGMKAQIPFLEKLGKFLLIYLGGWVTDKLIKMFSSKAQGNITAFLEYRDVLINQLGKFFAPVANIANGFIKWIAKTTARITGWAGRIGKKVFTKLFGMVRKIAIGMLNKIKDIVANPLKFIKDQAANAARAVRDQAGKVITGTKAALSKLVASNPALAKAVGGAKGFLTGAGKKVLGAAGALNKAGTMLANPAKALKILIPKIFGPIAGKLGGLLKKLIGGNIASIAIGSIIDVRSRLASGSSPTEAITIGLLKGLASGVIAGTVAATLSGPTFGLGALPGLLLGGFLGDAAGNLLVGPLEDFFAKQPKKPNEFDKWFLDKMSTSPGIMQSAFGLDTRFQKEYAAKNANGGQSIKTPTEGGAGTGDKTRVAPGGALKNSSALGPVATTAAPAVNVVVPPSTGKPAAPTQIPQKSLGTDIPIIESTNYDNPYLAFSYSIYNVLA